VGKKRRTIDGSRTPRERVAHRLNGHPPTELAPHRDNCGCIHCEQARDDRDREQDVWRAKQWAARQGFSAPIPDTFATPRDADGALVPDAPDIGYVGALNEHQYMEAARGADGQAPLLGLAPKLALLWRIDGVSARRALSALYAHDAILAKVVGQVLRILLREDAREAAAKEYNQPYTKPSERQVIREVADAFNIAPTTARERQLVGYAWMHGWLEGNGEPHLAAVGERVRAWDDGDAGEEADMLAMVVRDASRD